MSGFLDITPSSLSDMPGRVVVVTGGSSGIGLAMVELLLEKKATVVNLDIQPPVNDTTQSAEWIKTDIAEWSSQLNAFKSVIAKHGHIDVVYANAGVAEGESALAERVDPATGDPTEPAWSTVKTNLLGTLTTVKLALHYMKKSQKGGRIIMTSSRGGYMPSAMPVYAATKHAIIGLMRSLQLYTPQWKIFINVISPHITKTGLTAHCRPFFDDAGLEFQGADIVALAGLYLAQDENTMNGKCIDVTQGKFREVEDKITESRKHLYGENDFEPRNEKDMIAFMSTQPVQWE